MPQKRRSRIRRERLSTFAQEVSLTTSRYIVLLSIHTIYLDPPTQEKQT